LAARAAGAGAQVRDAQDPSVIQPVRQRRPDQRNEDLADGGLDITV
jgi:hypothetical protein